MSKEWALKLIYDMDKNYQNRKLKSNKKEDKSKNDLLEHLNKIRVRNHVDDKDVPPYESLGRTIG